MREGEIHTLLLDFLDIDLQQEGGDAPGISQASWRAEDPSGYRLSVSVLSLFTSLYSYPYHLVFYLHPSPPRIPASHHLSHMHLFCLSSPTLALFSHKQVLPQQCHLLRCTSFQAPSHLQSQAGVPAPSAGRSSHTRVMGSLLPGLALAYNHTWLWSKLAADSTSDDTLPSTKLWQGCPNWNNPFIMWAKGTVNGEASPLPKGWKEENDCNIS